VPLNAKCSTTKKGKNNVLNQDMIPISFKILFANWKALQGSFFPWFAFGINHKNGRVILKMVKKGLD